MAPHRGRRCCVGVRRWPVSPPGVERGSLARGAVGAEAHKAICNTVPHTTTALATQTTWGMSPSLVAGCAASPTCGNGFGVPAGAGGTAGPRHGAAAGVPAWSGLMCDRSFCETGVLGIGACSDTSHEMNCAVPARLAVTLAACQGGWGTGRPPLCQLRSCGADQRSTWQLRRTS